MIKRYSFAVIMVLIMLAFCSPLALAAGGHGEHHVNWGYVASLIFNFVAFIMLLFFLLKKPLGAFFADRSDSIADQLNQADKAREEAEVKIREYSAKIEDILASRDEVIAKAQKEADYEKELILQNARKTADRILADADSSISVEMEKAKQELIADAGKQIAAKAEELIVKSISDQDQKKLADNYIEMLREVKS